MFWERKKKEYQSSKNSPEIWLVAGLGNFGPEYENTRHNCGFLGLDALEEKLGSDSWRHKFKGIYREISYKNRKLVLLKPHTYMNNSGESISEAMHWYGIQENHLIVLYDDCDLALGAIRVRPKGSAGTHNGMKSVIQYTNSDEFARVRIGIGAKPAHFDMIKFVLGHFTPEERTTMAGAFDRAAQAVLSIVENGPEKTMNLYNSAPKAPKAENQ